MYFVGIDAGGSKCETLICNENAEIVGYGISFGSEIDESAKSTDTRGKNGKGRSNECIRLSFERALGNLSKDEDYYITFNQYLFRGKEFFEEINLNVRGLYASDEAEAVARAANIKCCYIALVGTGAFSYYMNGTDRLYFEGLGPNLGDYGSGFSIGHKAVKAVAMSEWGEEYRTSMAPIINKKILGKETNHYGKNLVVRFFDLPERNYVAEFAKIASEEAQKGDEIAKQIMIESGRLFGRTVVCLVKNVRPTKEKLPIVCTGSVLKSQIYKESFVQYVKERIDNEIVFNTLSSVYGNVMGSVKQAGFLDIDDYYKKLKNNRIN